MLSDAGIFCLNCGFEIGINIHALIHRLIGETEMGGVIKFKLRGRQRFLMKYVIYAKLTNTFSVIPAQRIYPSYWIRCVKI